MKSENNTLYIRNMVCNRCIKVVREELEKLGLEIQSMILGEVVLKNNPDENELKKIDSALRKEGFELLEDKRQKTIEKIKNVIIEYIQHDMMKTDKKINISDLLQKHIDRDYNTLSMLFSSVEGITIEHYFILQKIEKAKELLKYDELSLAEVAYKLGYSSVPHLSSQFKKTTGLTVSQFKKTSSNMRTALDKL